MQTIRIAPYSSTLSFLTNGDDIDLHYGIKRHDPNAEMWSRVDDARRNRKRGWNTPSYDRLP